MPLSDRERRMLAEMEAAMAQEDPKFVSTLTGKASLSAFSASYRRLSVGAGLIFLGMATIIAGLIAKVTLIGLAGFGIALIGALAIVSYFTARSGGAAPASPSAKAPRSKGPSWSQRMEERWERRNFDN